jgi:hypothetical protein
VDPLLYSCCSPSAFTKEAFSKSFTKMAFVKASKTEPFGKSFTKRKASKTKAFMNAITIIQLSN